MPHRVAMRYIKMIAVDTRPLEWAMVVVFVIWELWLFLFLGENTVSPDFWRGTDGGKILGLFKLLALPLAILQATVTLDRSDKSTKNRKRVAALGTFYWYGVWFTLAANNAWKGWQFFTAFMLFFPSYLYLLIQKAAVDPEVKKDAVND